MGLDVVESIKLFQQYHLSYLPELTRLYQIKIHSCTTYVLTKCIRAMLLSMSSQYSLSVQFWSLVLPGDCLFRNLRFFKSLSWSGSASAATCSSRAAYPSGKLFWTAPAATRSLYQV